MNGRANQGEELAGVAGLALILIMFLFAWYGLDAGGVSVGYDAFDAYRDWVGIILVFTSFAGMSLALFGGEGTRTRLPVPLSTATAVLGAVSAIIILIYIISPPGVPAFGAQSINVDLGRKIGCWLGLISAALVAAGGYLAMQEGAAPSRSRGRAPGGPGEAPPPSSGRPRRPESRRG
jgi:hypothetical protein